MNRLNGLACYLSGPISYAEDKGQAWRDELTTFLTPRNVRVFNPLKHVFYGTQEIDKIKRPRMNRLLKERQYDKLRREMKDLNHWDLRCVDLSSFLVVLYDPRIFTCGTHEEMFKALDQNKPVLLVNPKGKQNTPNWLYGRLPHTHIFSSFESVKTYLQNIDCNPIYKWTKADRKRWLFFDGPHMEK